MNSILSTMLSTRGPGSFLVEVFILLTILSTILSILGPGSLLVKVLKNCGGILLLAYCGS